MENISDHISYEEAINSATALRKKIDNTPSAETLERMKVVAEVCFEPARKWYGKPLKVNSFYRSVDLNREVGGSATSQHCKGEAIDITAGSKAENKKLFDWMKANLLFDQLINEYDYTWIHVSFRLGDNRNQTLIVK
jgi:zinc D-Ala-D-Ala carboxypeptidase